MELVSEQLVRPSSNSPTTHTITNSLKKFSTTRFLTDDDKSSIHSLILKTFTISLKYCLNKSEKRETLKTYTL